MLATAAYTRDLAVRARGRAALSRPVEGAVFANRFRSTKAGLRQENVEQRVLRSAC